MGTRPSRDPLKDFKYQVQIENPEFFPVGANLGFSKVTGLKVNIEKISYREGSDRESPRVDVGQASPDDVVLERGVYPHDASDSSPYALDKWHLAAINFGEGFVGQADTGPNAGGIRAIVYVKVALKSGVISRGYILEDVLPGTMSWGDLDASGNATHVQSLTLYPETIRPAYVTSGGTLAALTPLT